MKEYMVKIPVKGYETNWVTANSKEEALAKVINGEEILCEEYLEVEYSYKNEDEVEIQEVLRK